MKLRLTYSSVNVFAKALKRIRFGTKRPTRVIYWGCCVSFILFCSPPFAMDVSSTVGPGGASVNLKGEIVPGDFARLLKALEDVGGFPVITNANFTAHGREPSFYLNSSGGDVDEAIQIGRFFRKTLSKVTATGECSSACFLIWIGGAERDIDSDDPAFRLHRPRFNEEYYANLDADSAKEQYSKLEHKVRSYLEEMGAPAILGDHMMRVPSRKFETYRGGELLGLVGSRAPFFDEMLSARCDMLSEDEEDDLWKIQTVKANTPSADKATLLIQRGGMDDDTWKRHQEYVSNLSDYLSNFPKGYAEHLEDKMRHVYLCRRELKREQRSSAYPQLIASKVNPEQFFDVRNPADGKYEFNENSVLLIFHWDD